MQSKAATVEAYLKELPADRRAALETLRAVILKNLDKSGYQEAMQYGGIGYSVPHSVFPPGYHCDPKQPLPFAGIASQKNHMAVYMMCTYLSSAEDAWFRDAWKKTGKKLDMGKSCVRFKNVDDLALDVIGEAIKRVPATKFIEIYQKMLGGSKAKAKSPAKAVSKGGPKSASKTKVKSKSASTSGSRSKPKATGQRARA